MAKRLLLPFLWRDCCQSAILYVFSNLHCFSVFYSTLYICILHYLCTTYKLSSNYTEIKCAVYQHDCDRCVMLVVYPVFRQPANSRRLEIARTIKTLETECPKVTARVRKTKQRIRNLSEALEQDESRLAQIDHQVR